jgi:hypothetical protein
MKTPFAAKSQPSHLVPIAPKLLGLAFVKYQAVRQAGAHQGAALHRHHRYQLLKCFREAHHKYDLSR